MENESMTTLIKLEEIRNSLQRGSLNRINIIDQEFTFHQVVFEYTTDCAMSGWNETYGHYELVKINTDDLTITWKIVTDKTHAHYTPETLKLNSLDELISFLDSRYLKNSWMIKKKKAKRYLINDGVNDIPQSMR